MADFFSNLAGQVLGAAPEVVPLLPPRFAAWPGVPLPSGANRPQALADAPAPPDAARFSLPLINPEGPAASAPLPTLRQMSDFRSASRPPAQPGQPQAVQDRFETACPQQGDVRQDVATPVRPAVDDAQPHAPPSALPSSPTFPAAGDEPPTPPVIQAKGDSDTGGAVTASPAPRDASGDRPSKEMVTTEWDRALPPPPGPAATATLQAAPGPVAGQERSTLSVGLPDPPASMVRPLSYSQAEPVDTQPERVETESVKAQPGLVELQSELVEGHAGPVEGQPRPGKPHAEPAGAQLQPAAPAVALTVQRQATAPWQPLGPQAVPATTPDLPISAQARATPITTAPELTTASLEPTPPPGHAMPGSPEPAPGETWSMPRADAVASLWRPAAGPTSGEPEPAPTVRITIGRVVVRAAPAIEPPTARRVELPQPPLSLDQYLQGRQGGGR